MQQLIFIRHAKGVSKKGNNYDLVEVSDGKASFTLNVSPEVSNSLDQLVENEDINAEVHVGTRFGALSGTLVAIG